MPGYRRKKRIFKENFNKEDVIMASKARDNQVNFLNESVEKELTIQSKKVPVMMNEIMRLIESASRQGKDNIRFFWSSDVSDMMRSKYYYCPILREVEEIRTILESFGYIVKIKNKVMFGDFDYMDIFWNERGDK